ncbi:hypothetical protein HY570_00045 [Candidatus Micrarchaeota archaeon]|nr:hypothetical protein [Candidatus Micrarchaeota archaeon]
MKPIHFVFIISFLPLLVNACTFAEKLEVQVFDQQNKGIETAQVIITYQKNTNLTIDGKIAGFTDENGIFTTQLCNNVHPDIADSFYTIEVKTTSKSETRKTRYGENTHVKPGLHYESFTLPTTYQKMTIVVRDGSNNTYSNLPVTLTSPYTITRRTDANGATYFSIESFNSFTVFTSYEGVNVTESFNSGNESRTYYLNLPIFKTYVLVNVLDETNSGIENATVILTDTITRVNYTNFNGRASFYNINSTSVEILVEFQDVRFEQKYNLLESRIINIPFDLNPINFISFHTNISKDNETCSINFYANVSNKRRTASSTEADLNYSFDKSSWSVEKMSNLTNKSETILFFYSTPCPNNDSFDIYYTIKASDKYSSRETGPDQFGIKPPIYFNQTNQNASGNATISNDTKPPEPEKKPVETTIDFLITIFSLFIVGLGAITLVLIILHILKREKKN